MVAAVRVHKPGGPEALVYEDVQIPAPGQGQIKIKQHACGVNFIDCYFRMGMYPSPVGMPFIAGNESAGEVMAVGPGVTDLKEGDHVVTAFIPACGKCPPCRVGTTQLWMLLDAITRGRADLDDLAQLERLAHIVQRMSLCGLGQGAPNPIFSTLRYFRDEYLAHIADRVCPAGVCAISRGGSEAVPFFGDNV